MTRKSDALRQHIADQEAINKLHDVTDNDQQLTRGERNAPRPGDPAGYPGQLTGREQRLIDRYSA